MEITHAGCGQIVCSLYMTLTYPRGAPEVVNAIFKTQQKYIVEGKPRGIFVGFDELSQIMTILISQMA